MKRRIRSATLEGAADAEGFEEVRAVLAVEIRIERLPRFEFRRLGERPDRDADGVRSLAIEDDVRGAAPRFTRRCGFGSSNLGDYVTGLRATRGDRRRRRVLALTMLPTRVWCRRILIGSSRARRTPSCLRGEMPRRCVWHSMPLTRAGSLDPRGGPSCALRQRLLGRPASESGRLRHEDGSDEGDDQRWMPLMLTLLGSRARVFVHRELGRGGIRSNVGRAVMPTVCGAACGVHAER